MANAPKRVKGILKKQGLFTGLTTGVVYEFSFTLLEDSTVNLTVYVDNITISLNVPSAYIEELVQILDGPAADILFSNNK